MDSRCGAEIQRRVHKSEHPSAFECGTTACRLLTVRFEDREKSNLERLP